MLVPGRALRILLVSCAGVLLLLAGWTAYRAWQVQTALTATADVATDLREAVAARNLDDVPALVEQLEQRSGEARRASRGLTWSLLMRAPVIGDDAEAIRVLSAALNDLAGTGLSSAVEAVDDLEALTPREGRVDLEAVQSLASPTSEAAAALADADAELAGIDASGLVGIFRGRFVELRSEVTRGARALGAADKAITVLPTLLGGEEAQRHLVVFQNNAEVRATGGLPGSVVLLGAREGRLELVRQVAGNSFGRRATPLPLADGELNLFGQQMGTFFLDAGFTPDLPRAAELWRARWQELYPGPIDGLITIDTVALGYLVGSLDEPVVVDGVSLTGDTVVDELLHRTYLRYEVPAEQDQFFGEVSQEVFDRIKAGAYDTAAFLEALARATGEGRLQADFGDALVAEELSGTRIAGPRLDDPAGPGYVVTFDDLGADKMTYFLRTTTRLSSRYCVDGQQGVEIMVRLESVAPSDAATLPDYVTGGDDQDRAPGEMSVMVRVFASPGAAIGDLTVNGAASDGATQLLGNRTVVSVPVTLAPGDVIDLSLRSLSEADSDSGASLWVTPTLESPALPTATETC